MPKALSIDKQGPSMEKAAQRWFFLRDAGQSMENMESVRNSRITLAFN